MALIVLNCWAMKTTSIHKHLKTFCIPVEYTGQSNTWNKGESFIHPFYHSFLPSIREHSCKTGIPEDSKCILLLDNCNAHSNEFELQSENIFVLYLPPNMMPIIHPMDQGVIQNVNTIISKISFTGLWIMKAQLKNFKALVLSKMPFSMLHVHAIHWRHQA